MNSEAMAVIQRSHAHLESQGSSSHGVRRGQNLSLF